MRRRSRSAAGLFALPSEGEPRKAVKGLEGAVAVRALA